MSRGMFVLVILTLAILLSGCAQVQNIDSKEIEGVKIIKTTDVIGGSEVEVRYQIANSLPYSLKFLQDRSDIGIYLDEANIGDLVSVNPLELGKGENNITIVIRVNKTKLLNWWVESVNRSENFTLVIRSDLAFSFHDALLKVMYQKTGTLATLLLPTFIQNESGFSVFSAPECGNVTRNTTEIIYHFRVFPCEREELARCSLLVNGVNVTKNCSLTDVSSCRMNILHTLNNSRLIDALAPNLLNATTFRYEIDIVVNGVNLSFVSENTARVIFEEG